MHDIHGRLADVLLEVEAILRHTGKWEEERPSAAALSSAEPFCLDTLRFPQWLQWKLLPRMKTILEHRKPLPARSGIAEYAEVCLRDRDPHIGKLISAIRRFDELIAIQAGHKLH